MSKSNCRDIISSHQDQRPGFSISLNHSISTAGEGRDLSPRRLKLGTTQQATGMICILFFPVPCGCSQSRSIEKLPNAPREFPCKDIKHHPTKLRNSWKIAYALDLNTILNVPGGFGWLQHRAEPVKAPTR